MTFQRLASVSLPRNEVQTTTPAMTNINDLSSIQVKLKCAACDIHEC
jgi:hypothetical protein